MHAQLGRPGAPILMASDTPQAGSLTRGNNFSVAIDCDSVQRHLSSLALLSVVSGFAILLGFLSGTMLAGGVLGIWFAVVVGFAWLALMSLRLTANVRSTE
jgi:hypothetical protein